MDGSSAKWFSLREAFDHFADPELLRRVEELEPYALSHNKHTEHLYMERRKLCRTIDEAMIKRLKRGELRARGLDKFGPITEGVLAIAPDRWSVLKIRYDLDCVVGPGGITLVSVEICDANVSPAADNEQDEDDPADGFEHSPDYRHVKHQGIKFSFGPKQARVIEELHTASRTDDPWVHGKQLLGMHSRSASLYDLFKSKKNWRELIESDGRGRYRLNLANQTELNSPPRS